MIRNLLRKAVLVEDGPEKSNEEILDSFVELLCIADKTNDRNLYNKIVKETRAVAEDYISKINPLGYILLAEWFFYQKNAANSLLYHLIASRNGFETSREIIERVTQKAESDDSHALLLAESYFIIGEDTEGSKWLNKAKDLGSKAADYGISIRRKGNIRKVKTFCEIGEAVNSYIVRLFGKYIIDYSDLEERYYEKCTNFCRGYAYVKGAGIQIDENSHTVELSHGLKERVLVAIEEGAEQNSKKITPNSREKTFEALDALLKGMIVVVDRCDSNECVENPLGILEGACYGLNGKLDHEGNDLCVFRPTMKEYDGELSHFEEPLA